LTLGDGSKIEILGKTALNKYLEEQGITEYEIEKSIQLEPVEHALHIARQSIEGMMSKFGVERRGDVKCYLTGDSNFRKERATILPYKGNRDPFDKPIYLPDVRKYLIEKWGAEVVEGMEADDAIGIEATKPDSKAIICTIDKDLDMLPGTHYNWVKGECYEVDEREAWRNFFKQVLVGDRTDNIPGLEGIGEVKAAKILEGYSKPETMWCGVFQAYFNRYGLTYNKELLLKEALQEIADLLWIRRYGAERWIIPE
jgi:hypothetical protein